MDGIETRIASPRSSFGRASTTTRPPRQAFSPSGKTDPVIDIKQVAGRSFAVMGRNTVPFLALVAAAAAPERILYHTLDLDSVASFAILELVTVLTCAPLYIAVLSGALADLGGEPVSFGNCLRGALRAPLAASLLGLGSALAAWFLLIVPGIAPATRWAVAAPAAFAEGTGARTSLARSAMLTAPCRAQVRVLVLMLAGLAISRALAIMPVWGEPLEALPFFLLGNWLFPLLLTAFTAAASATLYHALTRETAA